MEPERAETGIRQLAVLRQLSGQQHCSPLGGRAHQRAGIFSRPVRCGAVRSHYSWRLLSTANQNFRRPLYLQNPAGVLFGTIHSLDDGSTASYNALLVTAQHRLASHFTILGNYTWSHCIAGAFTSELDGTQYTNPANRNFDRGNCAGIDHRTLINLSAVEEAPKFSNRALQFLAGDWKLSEIVQIRSGSYFSVTQSTDQALNSIGGQRASLIGSSPYPTTQTFAQWLNPSAFVAAPMGGFGMSPNNILGPGNFVINMALTRSPVPRTPEGGIPRRGLQPAKPRQPNNPGASISTLSTFGRITTFGDPRIMQFALKYYF